MKTDISEIKNRYHDSAKTYQNGIIAWQNVRRVTKKDGTNFANFSKNFVNAEIKQDYNWCRPSLKVSFCQGNGTWTYDTIEIEENDTVDNVFEKINNRVKLFNGYIVENERKARNVEYVFNEVDRTMVELTKFGKENGFSSYEICNYIKDNCWRL